MSGRVMFSRHLTVASGHNILCSLSEAQQDSHLASLSGIAFVQNSV